MTKEMLCTSCLLADFIPRFRKYVLNGTLGPFLFLISISGYFSVLDDVSHSIIAEVSLRQAKHYLRFAWVLSTQWFGHFARGHCFGCSWVVCMYDFFMVAALAMIVSSCFVGAVLEL